MYQPRNKSSLAEGATSDNEYQITWNESKRGYVIETTCDLSVSMCIVAWDSSRGLGGLSPNLNTGLGEPPVSLPIVQVSRVTSRQ